MNKKIGFLVCLGILSGMGNINLAVYSQTSPSQETDVEPSQQPEEERLSAVELSKSGV